MFEDDNDLANALVAQKMKDPSKSVTGVSEFFGNIVITIRTLFNKKTLPSAYDSMIGDMPNVPQGARGQKPRSNGFQHDLRR